MHGQWPEEGAQAFAAGLPYAKRLALRGGSAAVRASLAGVALALRALTEASGARVTARELAFPAGAKPTLIGSSAARAARCDFSIAHAGALVGCAAVRGGEVGFDLELGRTARLRRFVRCEAALKAAGLGIAQLAQVQLQRMGARCGGRRWHARMLECFAGASACSMTSFPVRRLEVRAIGLRDLFAS